MFPEILCEILNALEVAGTAQFPLDPKFLHREALLPHHCFGRKEYIHSAERLREPRTEGFHLRFQAS
jgi:hypothetical protein